MLKVLKWIMASGRQILGWTILTLCAGAAVLALSLTPSFEKCSSNYQTTKGGEQAEEGLRREVKLFIRCEAVSADENNGVITALATALLAYITYRLVVGGEKTTRQVNRAYVACGGDFNKTTRVFQLGAQNNGQTPAFMTAFDVQTALAGQIGSQSALPVNRNHARWEDTIPPRDPRGKTIETRVLVPQNVAFIFGCVWYRDVWGDPHHSRFILSVRHDPTTGVDRTFPDVAGMHRDYDERT
jgi:hypothetical protein